MILILASINLSGSLNSITGDGQIDNIVVNGTSDNDVANVDGDASGVSVLGLSSQINIVGAEATDKLTVQGQAGDDAIEASGLAAGAITLTEDGGEGDDVLVGGQGNRYVARRRWRRHSHRRRWPGCTRRRTGRQRPDPVIGAGPLHRLLLAIPRRLRRVGGVVTTATVLALNTPQTNWAL